MKETITTDNLVYLIEQHKIYLKELSGNVFPIGDLDETVLAFCSEHVSRLATTEDIEFILNNPTKQIEITETA
jgi:UTP-glucose-1-phosphate uridylyltransferase